MELWAGGGDSLSGGALKLSVLVWPGTKPKLPLQSSFAGLFPVARTQFPTLDEVKSLTRVSHTLYSPPGFGVLLKGHSSTAMRFGEVSVEAVCVPVPEPVATLTKRPELSTCTSRFAGAS